MRGEQVKQRVLQATDLAGLIGEHVALTARGREFVGLCPFHDDRSPSLNVSPRKQIYKCFACGAGGDAFSFVMDYHKMSFPEALRHLAERAGIELPKRGEQDDGRSSPRQRVMRANGLADQFFRRTLQDEHAGAVARRYLADRGISDEMIEAFGIGCAPDQWDALAQRVQRREEDAEAFEQAGLIAQRRSGRGRYDRFRHRLMLPIYDAVGRPVAFGGRMLPGSQREEKTDAKYLNSPEHPAFNKSATLYGLHRAHKPIIDRSTAVIVEGYTDVIACHQAGRSNVVATLGTALTAEHAKLLRRYCDRVILVFDADEAGQSAADRALGVFFAEPLDIDIAILPDGLDPAELLAKDDGPEHWDRVLAEAADAMSFQFRRVREAFRRTGSMAGRQRITEEYLRTLVQLGMDQLDRQRYGLVFARVADLLGMTPGAVRDAVRRLGGARPRRREGADPESADAEQAEAGPQNGRQRAERLLVGCLIERPELFDEPIGDGLPLSESIVPNDLTHPACHRIYYALHEWMQDHEQLDAGQLREALGEEELIRRAMDAQMEADRLSGGDPQRLSELARTSADALVQARAEQEYQQQKQQLRDTAEEDSGQPSDEEARRLELAIAHVSANPSARRMPRPIG